MLIGLVIQVCGFVSYAKMIKKSVDRRAIYAPNFDWRTLAGALIFPSKKDHDLANPWLRANDKWLWLGFTSESLKIIALLRQKLIPKIDRVCVWIPSFFCNSALCGLRDLNVDICFYPVTSELEPNYEKMSELAIIKRPNIFVLVHYFGRPSNSKLALDFCRKNDSWFVEDAAHVYLPISGVGECGDFVLYSPHKHLPLPKGALLIVRPMLINRHENLNHEIEKLVSEVDNSEKGLVRLDSVFWLGKRILQKCGIQGPKIVAEFSDKANFFFRPSRGHLRCFIFRRMLSALLKDLEWIRKIRNRNSEVLRTVFSGATPQPEKTHLLCEYLLRFNFAGEKFAKNFFFRMHMIGAPASTWPDLPPEVVAQASKEDAAIQLRLQNVYLHVHQGLCIKKLSRYANDKVKIVANANANIKFQWFTGTDSEWSDLYLRAFQPNILQFFGYVKSKSEIDFSCVKRGVFVSAGEIIAIFTASCRFPGVWRLNRGPLYIKTPTKDEQREIIYEIARAFSSRLLSISPNIDDTGENWLTLTECGFSVRKCNSPTTVWIDLSKTIESIRAGLAGKWRNRLSFSERSGLKLADDNQENAFNWICKKHEAAMRQNRYGGISCCLLKKLYKAGYIKTYRVILDGNILAGICLGYHGSGMTYLVGWNGEEGRSLSANHFLLWSAVLDGKKNGMRWFDLGGIDEFRQKSIADFKLGIGGQRVKNPGEFIRI